MRNVRAVSIGERMIADSDEDMNERINVVLGDAAVRMSAVIGDAIPSSGNPKMADRRLLMKVFRVGRRREYMNVALDAFHIEVGPLVDQSCDRTSMRDEGFLITSVCLGDDAGGCM